MLGTITHNWILYQALKTFNATWRPTQIIQNSNAAAHVYGQKRKKDRSGNTKDFENSRGWNAMNLWRFHNILEHHQDSYILNEKFFGEKEGFDSEDWESVNIGRYASDWFVNKADPTTYFIVDNSRRFYRYKKEY